MDLCLQVLCLAIQVFQSMQRELHFLNIEYQRKTQHRIWLPNEMINNGVRLKFLV